MAPAVAAAAHTSACSPKGTLPSSQTHARGHNLSVDRDRKKRAFLSCLLVVGRHPGDPRLFSGAHPQACRKVFGTHVCRAAAGTTA